MKKNYYYILLLFACYSNAQTIDLIPFKKGDQYGYCNKSKKIIIPIQYTNAYPFGYQTINGLYEDYASVENEKGWFIINKKGEIIDTRKDFNKKAEEEYKNSEAPPTVEELKTIGFEKYAENDKRGVKDENGNIILKATYDNLYLFSFSRHYDNGNHKYYKPTYASVESDKESYLIRVDQPKYYKDYTLTKYEGNDFFIVSTTKNGDKQYGIFTENDVKLYDSKYTKIMKYYKQLHLLFVTKTVNESSYDFYIDENGNEYYE
ncbi:WG repeat-containing protein [Flavobacterium adhaerens]|uniref:WG repeat-containing protein n=1 Tax=Flavobacterium adhaerens TaxID=3149043 RepID=UPI0032B35A4C